MADAGNVTKSTLGGAAGGGGLGFMVGGPIGAGIGAGVGALGGLFSSLFGGDDAPPPYRVNQSAFDYDPSTKWYLDHAQHTRDQEISRRYADSRQMGNDVRAQQLARIGAYRSQAENLQRQGMEQARLQQLAAAAQASPSTRAAAMRGASMNTAAAQQGIAGQARQQRLAEHMAQLQALQGVRGQDLGLSSLDLRDELQRQAFLLDKERVAQGYEGQAQSDRQYEAQLRALAEQTQAGAHGANVAAANAAAARQDAAANQLLNMGGTAATFAAMYGANRGNAGGGGESASETAAGVRDYLGADWFR